MDSPWLVAANGKSSWTASRGLVSRRNPLVNTSRVRGSFWRIIDVRCYTISSEGRFRHFNPETGCLLYIELEVWFY